MLNTKRSEPEFEKVTLTATDSLSEYTISEEILEDNYYNIPDPWWRKLISKFVSLFKKKSQWRCTRCNETCITIHDLTCGMPDYKVLVPYESGPQWKKPACPLERINLPTEPLQGS